MDSNALKGKKPNRVLPVPPEFRRPIRIRERDAIANDVNLKTGCTVIPDWDYQRGQDQGIVLRFNIFGTGAGLERATQHIQQWISKAPNKSKESSAWAKLPAFDANKWYFEQLEELEYERKQAFKSPPPQPHPCETPLHMTVVRWPRELDDRGISPRDVFNNKLEALDAIRTRDEVYITLLGNSSGDWQIEIQAYDTVNLAAAEEHLETMIEKVKDEEMGAHNSFTMVLDDQEGIDIVFERAGSWWPKFEDPVVPRLIPSAMMNLPGSFRREPLHPMELSRIQHSFRVALEAVKHRKGTYDLAIRLGCLAVRSKHIGDDDIGKRHDKELFLKSIDTSIRLENKRWLANDATGHRMFRSICAADDLFEPTKPTACSSYMPDALDKTLPTLRGTWVFRDPSSDISSPHKSTRSSERPMPSGQKPATDSTLSTSLVVIQVDWICDNEGMYDKSPPRFFRLEQGAKAPRKNMDINLLEMGESRGWHFSLESMIPVPSKSISPVLTQFAKQVRMRPGYKHQSAEAFAQWDTTSTVNKHLQTGRLTAIYSFGIKNTYYKVELTRIWHPTQKLPVWSLLVRHAEWANHLSELEHLPMGRKANWGDTVTTFLPDDGQSSYNTTNEDDLFMSNLSLGAVAQVSPRGGIRMLIAKLLQVSAVVSSDTDIARGVDI